MERERDFFQAEVIIDNEPYNLDVRVVPVEVMPMSCIIGRDILPLAEVRANKNSVEIKKYPTSNFLASITLSEKVEIDAGPINDTSVQKRAEDLLLNYKPNKTKSTNIESSIHLKENKSIFSRP